MYETSLPPSAACSFPPSSLPPRSLRSLFPSPSISPAGTPAVPASRAFIYINFAGFLLFGGFGAPLKRRKYKIIMIIMSHFARNNTVGAGIRRGSRAIRRANNVGRRASATPRTHVVSSVDSPPPPPPTLSLSLSLSLSLCLLSSPF